MHPILVEIGPLTIRYYGLMYVIAIAIGFYLLVREVRRKELSLSTENLLDLMLWTVPIAIVGARLYYVAFHWDEFGAHPADIVKIWEGGLAIHGGVLAGAAVVYFLARAKRVSFWRLTDALAPSLILGQAIGRIGNLMNGDAHGVETSLPWGIQFPQTDPSGTVRIPAGWKVVIQNGSEVWQKAGPTHPTMVYEMLLNLAIFAFLWWWVRKRDFKDGFSTALYFILYAIGRSIVSFVRADSLWLGPIRAAHAISILFVVGFGLLVWRRRLYRRAPTG